MRAVGIALLVTGVFLTSLSGLEKIIIFLDYNERVGDINSLKNIAPEYIWNITNFTFISGLLLLIIGLLILMKNQIKNQIIKLINDVKEMNKAYDNKGE
jgi:hypothetical protein